PGDGAAAVIRLASRMTYWRRDQLIADIGMRRHVREIAPEIFNAISVPRHHRRGLPGRPGIRGIRRGWRQHLQIEVEIEDARQSHRDAKRFIDSSPDLFERGAGL